jgi:hypothetical protein
MAAGTTVCPREVIVLRIDELRKFSYGNSAGWVWTGAGRQRWWIAATACSKTAGLVGVREQIAVIEHGNPGGGGFWADG